MPGLGHRAAAERRFGSLGVRFWVERRRGERRHGVLLLAGGGATRSPRGAALASAADYERRGAKRSARGVRRRARDTVRDVDAPLRSGWDAVLGRPLQSRRRRR